MRKNIQQGGMADANYPQLFRCKYFPEIYQT